MIDEAVNAMNTGNAKWTIHNFISSITVHDGKTMVCRCTQNEQGMKYARLIAAAPLMLEARKKIAEKEPAEYYECGGACDNCYDMIDLAREVMRVIEEKARGEE